MSETELRALAILARGHKSCANLGSELWGTKWRKPQAYCRPAGKMVKRLICAGLITRWQGDGWKERSPQFEITPKGLDALKAASELPVEKEVSS